MMNEKEIKNSIIEYFDLIKNVKDKVGIKSIIKKVLYDLNYKEIAESETVVHNLTIEYAINNNDFIESIDGVIEYFEPRIDEFADNLHNKIYNYIKDNYVYSIINNEVILEKKVLSFNGSESVIITDSYLRYLKHQISGGITSSRINIEKMIYDVENNTTKIANTNISSLITHIFDEDEYSICSNYAVCEYDSNGKMVSDICMKYESGLSLSQIDKYNIKDSDLNNLIVSDDNYYMLTEIRATDNENASFLRKEKVDQGYCEYKTIIPLKYDFDLIDSFTGEEYLSEQGIDNELDINENNFESITYQRFLEHMGLSLMKYDDSFKKVLRDKYSEMYKDLFTHTYTFRYHSMIPYDLDEKMIKTKGYINL